MMYNLIKHILKEIFSARAIAGIKIIKDFYKKLNNACLKGKRIAAVALLLRNDEKTCHSEREA